MCRSNALQPTNLPGKPAPRERSARRHGVRAEYAALAGRVPGATLARCGMGPARVDAWLPHLSELAPDAVVVAGVAGGVDPTLRPGDVVVATEVRDDHGRIVQRAAAPLVAELRRMGLRVRHLVRW